MTISSAAPVSATGAHVKSSIRKHQQRFQKTRGTRALAELVADAYVLIHMAWVTLSSDEQGVILDQHGIAEAAAETSKYTPWIKLVWGEPHADKIVRDSDGVERPLWVPDRSMEIYHHTMEELEHLGISANHADAIVGLGGAAAVAKKRKERLREESKPTREAEQEEKRKVFLAETRATAIETPIDLIAGTGEFFTLLCRKVNATEIVVLGVADSKAIATLNRMSTEQYDQLCAAAESRRQAEQREAEIQRRVDTAREEERMLLVKATPEILSQLRAEISHPVDADA